MADLTITIKGNSVLYDMLKKADLLENEKEIKNKLISCMDLESVIEGDDTEMFGYLKPELLSDKLNSLSGEALNKELTNTLDLIKNNIDYIVDFMEDRFFEIPKNESEEYVFLPNGPNFASLKYASEILPVIVKKIKERQEKV